MSHELSASKENSKKLIVVFSVTTIYMVIEAVAGFLTKSLALLADAGHMLTDAGGLGLALLAVWFSSRPATKRNSFGFYRMEILAAFINALVLLGISFFILYEAWKRFANPPQIQSKQMLLVAIAGFAVNLFSMFVLHRSSEKSLNLKGAYLEVLSDMLASVGVIAAGVIMLLTGWYYADPIISALIGVFILPRTWNLLSDAAHILLEGTPEHIDLNAVEQAVLKINGVLGIHDLHIWTITSGIDSLSAHISIENDFDSGKIQTKLEGLFKKQFQITHTTIQFEIGSHADKGCHIYERKQ
ncbi:MAG TPA: cation diffusion facilitator family transporter [Candidatus Omnitrophota bacterium]|nr:cation diffusion facilitator family transporter [Candidatus Omnitrophota bacterium]